MYPRHSHVYDTKQVEGKRCQTEFLILHSSCEEYTTDVELETEQTEVNYPKLAEILGI